jgi:hypothetical protein
MGWLGGLEVHQSTGKSAKKLIEAVVDAAYAIGDPPPELKLAWNCQRWNCLPDVGAYLDQDNTLMLRMNAFTNIYNLMQRWQSMSGKSIHSLSEGDRKLLRHLKDLGILFQ